MDPGAFVLVSGNSRIPIRNLWLLLLYASEFYKTGNKSLSGIEDYPERLPDLLGEILIASVADRLKTPLTPEFDSSQGDLPRVRGRIDVLRTESHQLLSRGQIACNYEELTVDTPRNRLVHSALTLLAPLVSSKDLRHRCRADARRLSSLGVSSAAARSTIRDATIQFSRNDAQDRAVLLAARLALQLKLPSDHGGGGLRRSSLSDHEFRRLFERAVGGFYAVAAQELGWLTRQAQFISWNESNETAGVGGLLPRMQTDMSLENSAAKRRIIIDTKFTTAFAVGQFGGQTIKSDYLYQIYTYVRSQEDPADVLTVATVDLGAPAMDIRKQLLDAIAA
jgi:5-methylcytosine-specific restriction enzyme subunit McrC